VARRKIKTTKHDIVRCALNLFLERGFSATTAIHIADAVDISTGNLTYYFPTKEHLLAELVDMLCQFEWNMMEEEAKESTSSLLAVCLELVTIAAACEQDAVAKDFFLASYRNQMTMELIRKNDKQRAMDVFREFCPDWTEEQYESAETLVSGIEYATLLTTEHSAPLETRIAAALEAILTIYQVPEQLRRQKIEKVLALDYRKLSLRILAEFRSYVDHKTEQALIDLQNS
jgi:AcrR family transcriptional regulator